LHVSSSFNAVLIQVWLCCTVSDARKTSCWRKISWKA